MDNSTNLTGRKFGRLTVLRKGGRKYHWLCRCICGIEKEIRKYGLLNGDVKSCGCLNKELSTKRFTKHGMKGTPVCEAWENMRSRCNNPKNKKFKHYGYRGIVVCKRWDEFKNFFQDMGEKPQSLTLERINTNGNYEPSNCKWATCKEQQRNRRNNRLIEYKGQVRCLAEWAERLGKDYFALRSLLKKYPTEIAFTL